MPDVIELPRLEIGIGGIDPDARLVNGEITQDGLDRFTAALQTPEFYDRIAHWQVPKVCVDGRTLSADGSAAAGGTTSVVMSDALTHDTYRKQGETVVEHAERIFMQLKALGFAIGGHDDDHAHGPNCGCGAQDKLAAIYDFIAKDGDDIRATLQSLSRTADNQSLGIVVPDSTHQLIIGKAESKLNENYVRPGAEIREVMVAVAGEDSIEHLKDAHTEVALIIDTRGPDENDTLAVLNKERLLAAFGPAYKAFYVNTTALKASADMLSKSAEEANEKFTGSLYYNTATACVLSKNVRVIVL
ncbi:MAG: hypothetical protein JWN38_216 [Candidatus Saccharibacteria bacterium]|nr:hypothetical protein [Candidatus Saccharibacteria bacterium]